MTPCPPPDRLRQLLDGGLPDPDQAAVADHVDRCPACQQALDRLTAAPPPARAAERDAAAETFIARVRALAAAPPAVLADTRPAPPAAPVPLPDIPGYEIAGVLGRGGMGVVYRARHRRLNRPVALKVLTDAGLADPGLRARFLVEAESVAQLHHPHVVQVYEFGEYAGRPYLAMEYVGGGNLAEALAGGRPVTPARAAELVARVADAVAAAHAKGIIHRDLKPGNILLAEPGPGGGPAAPKVADFGIARIGRPQMTATGELLGTPSYMAPEQAAGRPADVGTPADVYGLGAILYELLTGRPPFLGETAVDTLQQVAHTPPRPPRSVAPGVPRDLETVCLKCLEKDPRKRYPTAYALAADLRAYLDGRAIAARPPRAWERAARLARRHPVPVAAGLLIAATVVGAFSWVDGARRREANARHQAEGNEAAAVAARRDAERAAARAAFEQAVAVCEAGNLDAGLAALGRAREAADRAEDRPLARVVRQNLAAWDAHRPRAVRRFDAPDPARPVTAVAFADDGRVLVTGSRRGGPLRVWPAEGPPAGDRPLRELPPPAPTRPGVVGVFPRPNGRLLAVYESGHVSDWDLRTGTAVRHDPAADGGGPVRSAAATLPTRAVSGNLVGLGSADGTYRVWDLDRRAALTRPDGEAATLHFFRGPKRRSRPDRPAPAEPDPDPGPVTGIDFPDNGNMLLTAGEKEGVILLGLPAPNTGRLLDPVPDGRPDPRVTYHQFDLGGAVYCLQVRPDRQLFLAGGATAVSLWSIHDRERPLWVQGHPDRVTALAFTPDGRRCATADRGGVVRCWDVPSGAALAELRLPGPVLAVQFPPTGSNALLVGSEDGSSVLWQLPLRPELEDHPVEPAPAGPGVVIRIGSGPEQAVQSAGFLPPRPGAAMWAATPRRFLYWSGDGARPAGVRPSGDAEAIAPRGVAVGSDGRWAVLAIEGRETISVCDLSTTPPTSRRVPAAGVGQVAFTGPTTFVTSPVRPGPGGGSTPGEVGWWELDGAGGAARRAAWPLDDVTCLAPHPDGRSVLVGRAAGRRTGLWDLGTGREVGPPLPHPGAVTAAAVDPGGRWAATGGQDGGVRVWPVAGDRPPDRSPQHAGRVTALGFGTGRAAGVLATASSDGTARFWDVATGHPLGPPLRHPEAVLTVAFDRDGTRVITGVRNGYAKVWPVPVAATD